MQKLLLGDTPACLSQIGAFNLFQHIDCEGSANLTSPDNLYVDRGCLRKLADVRKLEYFERLTCDAFQWGLGKKGGKEEIQAFEL